MKHDELLQELTKWVDENLAGRFPKLPSQDEDDDEKLAKIARVVHDLSELAVSAEIADNVLDECSGGLHMEALLDLDSGETEKGAKYVIDRAKNRLERAARLMLQECGTYSATMFNQVGSDTERLKKAQDRMGGDLGLRSSGVFAMTFYILRDAKSQQQVANRVNMALELCLSFLEKARLLALSAAETPAFGTSADVNTYFNCAFMLSGTSNNVIRKGSRAINMVYTTYLATHGSKNSVTKEQQKPILH